MSFAPAYDINMPSDAAAVPDECSMLCEGCGYVLDGLPPDSRCPECGKLVTESTGIDLRQPPAWEDPADHRCAVARFMSTTLAVMTRPTQFYRNFATRVHSPAARRFSMINWLIASVLFGAAATAHWRWYMDPSLRDLISTVLVWLATFTASFVGLISITRLAAWLTAWEARYRGLRLSLPVVRRGMSYHTAHYMPVALIAVLTTVGYDTLWETHHVSPDSYTIYFYTICGEVVLGAMYLFHTYWIGMRNMMYANR